MNPSNETTGYKEIIQRAPKEYCQLVAKRIGLPNQPSVQRLREEISERVLNIVWLKDTVAHLHPHERSVLTTLTFLSGSHGVPVDLFNRKLKQLCRGWSSAPGASATSFTRIRFGFPCINRLFPTCLYLIPEDLQSLLLQDLFRRDKCCACFSGGSTQNYSQRWICAHSGHVYIPINCG